MAQLTADEIRELNALANRPVIVSYFETIRQDALEAMAEAESAEQWRELKGQARLCKTVLKHIKGTPVVRGK